jgi:hypothetical protein
MPKTKIDRSGRIEHQLSVIPMRFVRADTEIDETQFQWLKQRAREEGLSFESFLNILFALGIREYADGAELPEGPQLRRIDLIDMTKGHLRRQNRIEADQRRVAQHPNLIAVVDALEEQKAAASLAIFKHLDGVLAFCKTQEDVNWLCMFFGAMSAHAVSKLKAGLRDLDPPTS